MEKRNKLPISVQLLLEEDNNILLMKRKNTGYEDGKYCLPGGHVEAHEEIRKALIREIKEEIGIDYVDFIFKTSHWTGSILNNESDKYDEIIWVSKNELPKNILSFIPEILKNENSIYLPYNWDEN